MFIISIILIKILPIKSNEQQTTCCPCYNYEIFKSTKEFLDENSKYLNFDIKLSNSSESMKVHLLFQFKNENITNDGKT